MIFKPGPTNFGVFFIYDQLQIGDELREESTNCNARHARSNTYDLDGPGIVNASIVRVASHTLFW
jgi:hypothetical protein